MTKDDIIAMARQAGAHDDGFEVRFKEPRYLERFAALVAAAQREACAAMLEANAMACENPIYRSLLQANAQAIREMGQP